MTHQSLPDPAIVPLRDAPNTSRKKHRSGLFILLAFVLLVNSFGAVYFTGIADSLLSQIGIPVWAELSGQMSRPEGEGQPPSPTPLAEEENPSARHAIEMFSAGDDDTENTPIPSAITDFLPTVAPLTLDPWDFASQAPAQPTITPLATIPPTAVPSASTQRTPALITATPSVTPNPTDMQQNPSDTDAAAASLQAYLQSTQGGIYPASLGGPRLNDFAVAPNSAMAPVTLIFSLVTNDMVKEIKLTANNVLLTPDTYVSPTLKGDQLVWKIAIPFKTPYTGDIRARLRYGDGQSNWVDGNMRCTVDIR